MSLLGRIVAWSDARSARAARRALLRSPNRYQVNRHRRAARSLEAAEESNLFSGWGTSPVSINRTIFQSLTGARARSRDRALNDPYAKRFLNLTRNNVVGPKGPRLRSMVRTQKGKPDRELRDIVERGWNDFAGSKSCDISRRLNLRQFCNAIVNTVPKDGEALVRIWRGPVAGKWGIALQFLDAEHLDIRMNSDLGDGRRIVMGVELDEFDRAIAYWFKSSLVDEIVPRRATPRHYRIAAEDILHVFLEEDGLQIRGLPWFAPSLKSMKMLHGYFQDAEKAARVGANASIFIKSPSGDETVAGSIQRDDGDLEIEFDDDLIGHQLRSDQELVDFDPRYPHEQFDDFVKSMIRRIAAGLPAMNYHTLGNDLEGVNFSSIRSAELETREAWKALQEWLFDNFVTPVFLAWLESALLNGQLRTARGTPLPSALIDRLSEHGWLGKRWSWVDPLKDATANEKLHHMNALSLTDIIESLGGDREQTLEQIAADRDELQRLRLPVSAPTAKTPAAATPPMDPSTDPDADPDAPENGDGDAE